MIFCERSGCEGCVIHPKKSETPHCLLGRFFVRRSPRKKTWPWFSGKVLGCEARLKKNWKATWFSGKVLGAEVDSPKKQKDLKRHMVFWEGSGCEGRTFWLWSWTHKDYLKCHIVFFCCLPLVSFRSGFLLFASQSGTGTGVWKVLAVLASHSGVGYCWKVLAVEMNQNKKCRCGFLGGPSHEEQPTEKV